MTIQVLMPQLGESVIEGTVAKWLIAAGQPVQQSEPLLQITTDKVDTELPAPASGILLEILVAEGQTVPKGTVLAVIGTTDDRRRTTDDRTDSARPTVRLPRHWRNAWQPSMASIWPRSRVQAPTGELPKRMSKPIWRRGAEADSPVLRSPSLRPGFHLACG